MKCEYCGAEDKTGAKICDRCGAKLPERGKENWKSEPFYYNGFICYQLRNMEADSLETQFWMGCDLVERICLPVEFVKSRCPDGYDIMPLFWDLFLVARGEKQVYEWQEKNAVYPARFEIRRIESPEKLRLLSLDRFQLASEFVRA